MFSLAELERDDSSLNRHPALASCLSMIPRVEPEDMLFPKTGIHPASSAGQAFSGSCSRTCDATHEKQ
jgi:hypothetical protein